MFRSTIIARFHHLYLLQALIELQRVWSKLYSKLKHRVLFVVDKKLRSDLMKTFRGKIPIRKRKIYGDSELNQQPYCHVEADQRNLYQDLNTIFTSSGQQQLTSSVSVPMQILMMPMLVQPCNPGPNPGFNSKLCNPTLEEFVTTQRQQLCRSTSASQDRVNVNGSLYKAGWSSIGDIHKHPSAVTMRNLFIS